MNHYTEKASVVNFNSASLDQLVMLIWKDQYSILKRMMKKVKWSNFPKFLAKTTSLFGHGEINKLHAVKFI